MLEQIGFSVLEILAVLVGGLLMGGFFLHGIKRPLLSLALAGVFFFGIRLAASSAEPNGRPDRIVAALALWLGMSAMVYVGNWLANRHHKEG